MSSVAVTSGIHAESRSVARGRFALFGLATVVAATVANVLVYYLGAAIVGYDPLFVILQNAGGAIFFTLPAAIVAVVLYSVLLRTAKRPERTFSIISAVVLVLSIVPDITYIPTVEGSSNGQTAVLIMMHIVAAAVIVGMLTRYTRQRAI
jgi:Kef-type K+ transport system membrane component KefB